MSAAPRLFERSVFWGNTPRQHGQTSCWTNIFHCASGKLRQKRKFNGGTKAQPLCGPLQGLCRLGSAESCHLEPSRHQQFGLLWADQPFGQAWKGTRTNILSPTSRLSSGRREQRFLEMYSSHSKAQPAPNAVETQTYPKSARTGCKFNISFATAQNWLEFTVSGQTAYFTSPHIPSCDRR